MIYIGCPIAFLPGVLTVTAFKIKQAIIVVTVVNVAIHTRDVAISWALEIYSPIVGVDVLIFREAP